MSKEYQPSFPVEDVSVAPRRLCMLIWGPAAGGKTTWVATAPGQKLFLAMGDNEHASLMGRKDVKVMHLYKQKTEDIFKHGAGAFGLDRYLLENRDIKTVILDSLTMLQHRALERAVGIGMGASPRFTPTMIVPGKPAYGGRLQFSLLVMDALMQVTAKHNVHMIFTAHESDPRTKPDGKGGEDIVDIPVSLGGQLINLTTSRLSEIWHLRQDPGRDKKRIITIRNSGFRRPMRSKMFSNKGSASFVLEYDAERPDTDKNQMTIAKFYEQWTKSSTGKIIVPDNRRGGDTEDNADRPRRTLEVVDNSEPDARKKNTV